MTYPRDNGNNLPSLEEKLEAKRDLLRLIKQCLDAGWIYPENAENFVRVIVIEGSRNSYPPTVIGWRFLEAMNMLSEEEKDHQEYYCQGVEKDTSWLFNFPPFNA